MRRLEAERIEVWPIPGKPGTGTGWGRRCGLGAAELARQPASMAKGSRVCASPRSGVAPARRASHARHPGGVGAPLRGYYGPRARSWLTVRAERPGRKRGPTPERKRRQWSAGRRARLAGRAPRLEADGFAQTAQACLRRGKIRCASRRSTPLTLSMRRRRQGRRCPRRQQQGRRSVGFSQEALGF